MTYNPNSPEARAYRMRLAEFEREQRNAEDRKRRGVCGCGHSKDKCDPSRCSHPFARDAMWGNS